jgi:hypothetical protein
MRRREHNAFHSVRGLAGLLAQRQDGQAVLFDTDGLATDRGLSSRLLQLRDMAATTPTRMPFPSWRSMPRRRIDSPPWQRCGG